MGSSVEGEKGRKRQHSEDYSAFVDLGNESMPPGNDPFTGDIVPWGGLNNSGDGVKTAVLSRQSSGEVYLVYQSYLPVEVNRDLSRRDELPAWLPGSEVDEDVLPPFDTLFNESSGEPQHEGDITSEEVSKESSVIDFKGLVWGRYEYGLHDIMPPYEIGSIPGGFKQIVLNELGLKCIIPEDLTSFKSHSNLSPDQYSFAFTSFSLEDNSYAGFISLDTAEVIAPKARAKFTEFIEAYKVAVKKRETPKFFRNEKGEVKGMVARGGTGQDETLIVIGVDNNKQSHAFEIELSQHLLDSSDNRNVIQVYPKAKMVDEDTINGFFAKGKRGLSVGIRPTLDKFRENVESVWESKVVDEVSGEDALSLASSGSDDLSCLSDKEYLLFGVKLEEDQSDEKEELLGEDFSDTGSDLGVNNKSTHSDTASSGEVEDPLVISNESISSFKFNELGEYLFIMKYDKSKHKNKRGFIKFDLRSLVKDLSNDRIKSKIPKFFYDQENDMKAVIHLNTDSGKALDIIFQDNDGKGYAVRKKIQSSVESGEGNADEKDIDDELEKLSPSEASSAARRVYSRFGSSSTVDRDRLKQFWNDKVLGDVVALWERESGNKLTYEEKDKLRIKTLGKESKNKRKWE